VLVPYALGLSGYSAVKIATPAFYALGESRTPVLVAVISVLTNAFLNVVLVRYFGYVGLAAGTSAAALLNAGVLLLLLRRRLGGLEGRRLAGVLVRTLAVTLVMAWSAGALIEALTDLLPSAALWAKTVRLLAVIAGSLVVLVITARLAGLREMTDLVGAIFARLRRTGR
jgi:putative peptidoglycan lipid II flippase